MTLLNSEAVADTGTSVVAAVIAIGTGGVIPVNLLSVEFTLCLQSENRVRTTKGMKTKRRE